MTTEPKPLNRLEVWIADRAAPIFGVLVVLILLGAIAVFVTYERSGDAQNQVDVLRPQVTRINKAVCDARSLEHDARAAACAERIRVGLVNCRRVQPCRAALIAAITYPPPARSTAPSSTTAITTAPSPEGGGAQNPSTAGQQPGPGKGPQSGGGNDHGGDVDQGGGDEPSPSPSPGVSGPAAPEPGPPAESPGKAPEAAPGGGSASGVGVEVCVPRVTCIEAEVGLPDLKPKGLP